MEKGCERHEAGGLQRKSLVGCGEGLVLFMLRFAVFGMGLHSSSSVDVQ